LSRIKSQSKEKIIAPHKEDTYIRWLHDAVKPKKRKEKIELREERKKKQQHTKRI